MNRNEKLNRGSLRIHFLLSFVKSLPKGEASDVPSPGGQPWDNLASSIPFVLMELPERGPLWSRTAGHRWFKVLEIRAPEWIDPGTNLSGARTKPESE